MSASTLERTARPRRSRTRSRTVNAASGCTRRLVLGGAGSRSDTTGGSPRGTAALQLRGSCRALTSRARTSTGAGSGGGASAPKRCSKCTDTLKKRILIVALPSMCHGVGPASDPVKKIPNSRWPR